MLSRIQDLRLTQENALKFLYITAFVTPEFLALLESKDKRSVFILGWWFKMMRDGELWWMARRAKVEGEAIRVWLQREEPGLAELLDSLGRRKFVDGGDVIAPQSPGPSQIAVWGSGGLPAIEAQ